MASTRDHVSAYDYESRRRVTSLMQGADEARRDPRRRLNRTLIGSTVIAVLVMAGAGIAGWLGAGRGPKLPDSGAVMVKGRGETYVVIDGVVHPALNLASALLVGGNNLTQVRGDALDGRPRGLPIGIPNVPNSLPGDGDLTTGPWTVCLRPSDSTVVAPEVTVVVGLDQPRSGVLSRTDAVVAVGEGGTKWLVQDGRRYELAGVAVTALGLQRAAGIPVPAKVLDTIPAGQPVREPDVAATGAPPASVDLPVDANVGDLVQAQLAGQPDDFYVVRDDGLSPISEFTHALLAVNPDRRTLTTDKARVATVHVSSQAAPGQPSWPDAVPTAREPQRDQPLCVSTVPGGPAGDAPWAVSVSLPPEPPAPPGVDPVRSQNDDLPGVATSVLVAPGTGALVIASSSARQDGTFTLVTDAGQRFPISSADAVSRLRYDPSQARTLPLPFAELLPSGPVLDPDIAARELPGAEVPATPSASPS